MPSQVESSRQAPSLPPLAADLGYFDSIPLTGMPRYRDMNQKSDQDSVETTGAAGEAQSEEIGLLSRKSTAKDRLLLRQPSVSDSTKSSLRSQRQLPSPIATVITLIRPIQARCNDALQRNGFHGWRAGVLFGCCMSAFVLCCNIGLVVAGATSHTGYNSNGIADLITGDQVAVSRWNTIFHVLINALSTLLLAGSNYTMQVLSSPTRLDVHKAHAEGQWLDIGILSPRNLRIIPRRRAVLWLILGLSSIPLHLFYNASVFKIVTSNSFNIFSIDVQSEEWERLNRTADTKYFTGTHKNLTNSDWNNFYNQRYMSVYGDLYLAIDRVAFDTSQEITSRNMSDYMTMNLTRGQADLKLLTMESSEWIRYNYTSDPSKNSTAISFHVAHAFSQKKAGEPSRVQISLYFMVVVIVFNLLKLLIMASVLLTDQSAYLVTLGDAAASFLERHDPTTVGKCMLGKEEMVVNMGYSPIHPLSNDEESEDLRNRARGVWSPGLKEYFLSVTRQEKVVYTQLILWVTMIMLLAPVYSDDVKDSKSLGTWAWGSSSDDSLSLSVSSPLSSTATLINAVLVNLPQLLLSFGYLTINTICTSMVSAEEWNQLAVLRKALRVTQPRGAQRSTYFLQLPYRWSLPLIITSGTLHWLLSQSFFLVRVDFFDPQGVMVVEDSISACGFSTSSLYALLIASLVLLAIVGYLGLRKMQMRSPIVASCSLAISAACHPPAGEKDTHLAKVKWGLVGQDVGEVVGHCSLSSSMVRQPEEGKIYR